MARYTATLTTAAPTQYIGTLNRPRALTNWIGSFFAYGTFGGGTISWQVSPDGTTSNLVPLTNSAATAITSTAATSFTIPFGNGNTIGDSPKFYATIATSTAATVTVGYFDNF